MTHPSYQAFSYAETIKNFNEAVAEDGLEVVIYKNNLFPDYYPIEFTLTEDLAAEQKARTTYDNILRTIHDPEICDPIRFLRAREVVHFQRFGEALRIVQDKLDSKNFYIMNPEFDKTVTC